MMMLMIGNEVDERIVVMRCELTRCVSRSPLAAAKPVAMGSVMGRGDVKLCESCCTEVVPV